jgi:integrase
LNLRRSTEQKDEGILRRHILPPFGQARMTRITRIDVQLWIKTLSDDGLGPESVRRCHRMLRAILADAVDDRIIPESPCRRISLPRLEHREQLHLTAQEVERLATAMDALYRPLVYSAVHLGCRWGELAGLKRENLDLLRRQVRIVGTLEEVRGMRYVEETKTRTSRRNLSLPASLAELLAEHLSRAPRPTSSSRDRRANGCGAPCFDGGNRPSGKPVSMRVSVFTICAIAALHS